MTMMMVLASATAPWESDSNPLGKLLLGSVLLVVGIVVFRAIGGAPTNSDDMNKWSIRPELVGRMRDRLKTDFADFVMVCDKVGLVNNFAGIDKLAGSHGNYDVDFTCAMCASAVVSAANHYGGHGELTFARRLATWALALEPNHVPALLALAAVCQVEGDANAESAMRRSAGAVVERLLLMPESRLSCFEQGVLRTAPVMRAAGMFG